MCNNKQKRRLNMDFGKIMKKLREERGLKQIELANATGISKSSISMYENGNRTPELETFELLADFYNVDMNYLKGKSDIKRKSNFDNLLIKEEEHFLELYQRPELRMLLETVSKKNKKQIESIIKLVESFNDVE
jgi:transcriptional regulator with XRE-family HTH domain